MAAYTVHRVKDATLSGTTEDQVTVTGGGILRIENRSTTTELVCRIGEGTLSTGTDECINVPANVADIVGEFNNTVVLRIVGDGNRYIVRSVPYE